MKKYIAGLVLVVTLAGCSTAPTAEEVHRTQQVQEMKLEAAREAARISDERAEKAHQRELERIQAMGGAAFIAEQNARVQAKATVDAARAANSGMTLGEGLMGAAAISVGGGLLRSALR